MKRHPITLGASTTAGGKVISASSNGDINGAPIALEGDMVACKECKGTGRIVCVGPRIPETWNGKQVALENDLCACRCSPPPRLLANQTVRYQTSPDIDAGPTACATPDAVERAGQTAENSSLCFDDKFVLVDDMTGLPLAHKEYAIARSSGKVEFGITDDGGRTHLLAATAETDSVEIYL
jgi:uncharacterized Zn-binding protein involved in type VI secretion